MVGLMEFELEFSPTSKLDRKAASSLFTRLGLALSLLLSTVKRLKKSSTSTECVCLLNKRNKILNGFLQLYLYSTTWIAQRKA